MPRARRSSTRSLRQVHLRLTSADYVFVQKLARSRDESVSQFFRRLIRRWRDRSGETGTATVPKVAESQVEGETANSPPGRTARHHGRRGTTRNRNGS